MTTSHWNMDVSSDYEDTAFFMSVYLVENGEAYNITETKTANNTIYLNGAYIELPTEQ